MNDYLKVTARVDAVTKARVKNLTRDDYLESDVVRDALAYGLKKLEKRRKK